MAERNSQFIFRIFISCLILNSLNRATGNSQILEKIEVKNWSEFIKVGWKLFGALPRPFTKPGEEWKYLLKPLDPYVTGGEVWRVTDLKPTTFRFNKDPNICQVTVAKLSIRYFGEFAVFFTHPCLDGKTCYGDPTSKDVVWKKKDYQLDLERLSSGEPISIEIDVLPGGIGYILFDQIILEIEGTSTNCTPTIGPPITTTDIPTTSDEPTTQLTTEPTTELTTDPTTQLTTDPTTQLTTDPTTQLTTDPTTQLTTDPTTQLTTDPTTELTTDPTTDSTTADTSSTTETTADTSETTEVTTPTSDTTTTEQDTETSTSQATQSTTDFATTLQPTTTDIVTTETTKPPVSTTTTESPSMGASPGGDPTFTTEEILLYFALPSALALLALIIGLCCCACNGYLCWSAKTAYLAQRHLITPNGSDIATNKSSIPNSRTSNPQSTNGPSLPSSGQVSRASSNVSFMPRTAYYPQSQPNSVPMLLSSPQRSAAITSAIPRTQASENFQGKSMIAAQPPPLPPRNGVGMVTLDIPFPTPELNGSISGRGSSIGGTSRGSGVMFTGEFTGGDLPRMRRKLD